MAMNVQALRDSRNTLQSRYTEFNHIKSTSPHVFIAFFEGYDAPYYAPFIEQIANRKVEQIICGNKKAVIAVHDNLFQKNVLKDCITGFFIDRDFDDNSTLSHWKDYYVTSGYSIENYYCSLACFEQILKWMFHYNCAHKDYQVHLNNFLFMQAQYNYAILEFNAWYCTQKRTYTNPDISLDDKIASNYVDCNFQNYTITKKYTLTQVYRDYPKAKQVDIADIRRNESWIRNDMVANLRGKFELRFLINYLTELRDYLKDGKHCPFEPRNVRFNVSFDDAISSLAQYAVRDENLALYIRRRCMLK